MTPNNRCRKNNRMRLTQKNNRIATNGRKIPYKGRGRLGATAVTAAPTLAQATSRRRIQREKNLLRNKLLKRKRMEKIAARVLRDRRAEDESPSNHPTNRRKAPQLTNHDFVTKYRRRTR